MNSQNSPARFFCLVFGLLLLTNFLLAQTTKTYKPDKIIAPSPTSASLGKYGNVPVSFYNGTPSIFVPLYDIKTVNHALKISMQYDASGIKVSQDASWVGLGWSLSAGGVITRIVRQQDDFIEHGYYHAAALPLTGDAGPNREYLNNVLDSYIDAEPDIYSYNFNGYSGRFVLGKKADGAPVFLDEKNNLKIEYLDTQGKWIITTGEGYKYYFSTSENTQDYSKNTLYEATDINGVQGLNMDLNSSPITGWYLDSIIAPTGETINFTYVKGKSLSLISRSEAVYQLNKIYTTDCPAGNLPGGSHTYSVSRQAITDVYLKTITFATGSIEFNTTPRNDIEYISNNDGLLTPSKLDNIIIRNYSGAILKRFSFNYSHFNSLRSNGDDIYNRLKLDAITEYSSNGVANPPYLFSYNNPNSLPDKYSKGVDHWGFSNGKANYTLLPTTDFPLAAQSFNGADRTPDTLEVLPANGVLNKIKYPTGGSTTFEYELNDYSNLHDELLHRWVNKYAEVRSNPYAPPGYNVTNTTFTIKPRKGCAVDNNLENCKIPVIINCSYQKVNNDAQDLVSLGYSNMRRLEPNGSTTAVAGCTSANYGQSNPSPTFWNHNFLPGNYQMDVLSNQNWSFFMSISWKEEEDTNLVRLKGGGIRVKRITDEDAAGHTTIRKYLYTDNTGKSSGVLLTYPKYDVTYDVWVDSFQSQGGIFSSVCTSQASYTALTSGSIYPSGLSSKSGTVGYSKVTELLGENGENGKTEYNFHCQEEIRDDFPGIPTASDPFNGKMDSVKYYNAQGGIVKRDNYHYVVRETNALRGVKLFFNYTLAGDGNMANNYRYYTKFYDNNSYWTVNDLKTETIYSGNVGHTSTTSYAFASNIHREATQTTVNKSDGSQLITKYKRPSDYTVSGNTSFAEQMTGNHVITPIVEEQTFLLKNGVTTLLSGAFTNYRKYNNLYFKPDLIYQIETNTPLSVLTESSFSSGGQPVIHPNYKPTGYNDLYDLSGGNLLSRHLYNGPSESYFWGYKNQYPIAQITGVDYNTAKQYVDTALLNNPATTKAQLQTELNKIRTGLASINAQVTTFIYDPLVGIVSSTDPKGMTTTYEYDNFLRLINVKNKDGNIVKHMDYHYQGQ